MNRLRPVIRIILPIVRNKYLLTGLLFVVWVGFIDDNNIIAQVKARMKLAEVERERTFYLRETEQSMEELKLLQNDRELLERFARERYLMKRPDEDIFVFTVED
jgi:cell division protein DivIC